MHAIMLVMMLGLATGFAQVTTIVNYDFNSGTTYNTLTPILESGVTCTIDGVSTYSLAINGSTTTGPNAFTVNKVAGNGLVMTNSSGTNSRYFEFLLSGADLSRYYAYKIYFQAQRGGAGAAKITVAYSTDGDEYSYFSPTQAPGIGAPTECMYDLSSITDINHEPILYIRLLVSGASGTGAMGIDNFQIRATKCTTPANISAGPNKVLTCTNPSAVLTGSSTTSGVLYSWLPGGTKSSSITVTSPATYTLTVGDPATGCTNTITTSVTTNTTPPGLGIAPVPTSSLTGYWPFNGNANDASGTANHGAVTGASLTADRFGNPNQAYYFNGTSNRIDVPHSSSINMTNGNDYSVSFWMKTDPGNGYALPVSKAPLGGGWNGYHFFVNCTDVGYCNGVGKFSFYTASGANGDACADNLISNDFNNWYFITGQYKGSTNQTFLYVNGVLQSDVGSVSGTLSNTAPLSFGACACGPYQFYKGALDDIRFYKRLLSQSEINALYNEANPVSVMSCGSPALTLIGYSPTAGVTYSWSPGGATTQSLSVTSGGTYTLKVTDPSNGCSSTSTTSILQNLCSQAAVTNYTDDLLRGQVDLHVAGGTGPYTIAWNNIKPPSSTEAYHALLSQGYPLGPDSVIFKNRFDSIKQSGVYTGLVPGKYPVTIYDAVGDSLKVVAMVGSNLSALLTNGVTVTTVPSRRVMKSGKLYAYGPVTDLSVSGSIVAGENMAVLSEGFSFGKASLLEFEVPDTAVFSMGLAPVQAVMPYDVDDIRSRFAFSFNGNSYSVYVSSVLRYTGSYQAGDLFSISNSETGSVKFYRNNAEVWAADFLSVAAPGDELVYKAVLRSPAAKLRNVLVLVPKIFLNGVSGTVKDVTCDNPCSGSIDAIGRGLFITSPIKYELYSGSNPTPVATISSFPAGNRALFSGLCTGKYTVKFHYNYTPLILIGGTPVTSTGVLSQNFEIAYLPDWTNVVNVTISPDRTLTKTGGAAGWDAGASAENLLKSTDNGWIEWTTPAAYSSNVVGFNDADQSVSNSDVDYANVYLKSYMGSFLGTWRLFMKMQNGVLSPVFYNYSDNQKFRLEKEVTGGITTIKLTLNGTLMDQFTGISASDYVPDVSMYEMLGTVNNPRVSFGCVSSTKQHAVLKRQMDGGHYLLDGTNLRFTLDGEYTSAKLKYKVLDRAQATVISDLTANVLSNTMLKNGDNRYSLDCSSLAAGYYTLEVSNEKNEKLYLRFKR